MRGCNCTLGGTKACFTCPNNTMVVGHYGFVPYKEELIPFDSINRIKRVIEKFDDKGNLIERITEEDK